MANVLQAIMTAGVAILAIAIIALVTGKTVVSLPAFNTSNPNEAPWATTMNTVTQNASTSFNLLGIAPLVLAAAVIISILLGAFVYAYSNQ